MDRFWKQNLLQPKFDLSQFSYNLLQTYVTGYQWRSFIGQNLNCAGNPETPDFRHRIFEQKSCSILFWENKKFPKIWPDFQNIGNSSGYSVPELILTFLFRNCFSHFCTGKRIWNLAHSLSQQLEINKLRH